MPIVCTKCGSSEVYVEAYINPNSKEKLDLDHFSDESFSYGQCHGCGSCCIVTDTEQNKENLLRSYQFFVAMHGKIPCRIHCSVEFQEVYRSVEDVDIVVSDEDNDYSDFFYVCKSIDELLKLADFGTKPFMIDFIHGDFIILE